MVRVWGRRGGRFWVASWPTHSQLFGHFGRFWAWCPPSFIFILGRARSFCPALRAGLWRLGPIRVGSSPEIGRLPRLGPLACRGLRFWPRRIHFSIGRWEVCTWPVWWARRTPAPQRGGGNGGPRPGDSRVDRAVLRFLGQNVILPQSHFSPQSQMFRLMGDRSRSRVHVVSPFSTLKGPPYLRGLPLCPEVGALWGALFGPPNLPRKLGEGKSLR